MWLKKLLLATLGKEKYLQLISRWYLLSFKLGWLKSNPAYYTHYYVRHLIKTNDTILDIGANLGYYSTEFARLTGPGGQVLCVEPIPVYRKILERNTSHLPQITILPFALGEQEGVVQMGLPGMQHRHGLMKVLNKEELDNAAEKIAVPVKNPLALFEHLPTINYIKCDIEGYEVPVIPAMLPLLLKHRPIVQVETDGKNKTVLFNLFKQLGYQMYYVRNQELVPYQDPTKTLPADLIALP